MAQPDDKNPYRPPASSSHSARDSQTDPKGSDRDFEARNRHGKLVVLSTFDNATDAHLFRNELVENGIDACVANESTTAAFGATIAGPTSAFWIEVLVFEADAEKALEVKEQWIKSVANSEVETPEWNCKCGETVDAGFAVCWNCGDEYETFHAEE